MLEDTKKKLGLCWAYEWIMNKGGLICDEYNNMLAIVEKNDEFEEWQNNLNDPEVKEYRDKIVKFFESL